MPQELEVRLDNPEFDPLRPKTMAEVLYVSDTISRSELCPYNLRGKPASVFYVIMAGMELDLTWPTALKVIYSPSPGQTGIRGKFLLAQLLAAGHHYEFEEGEDWCTFRLWRKGQFDKQPFSATFSDQDAIDAGLAKRDSQGKLVAMSRDNKPMPWMNWTRRMRRWRAVSECCDMGAPEVSLGFDVAGEEMPEGREEVQLQVAPETPAPGESGAGKAAAGSPAQELANLEAEVMGRGEPEDGGVSEGGGEQVDPEFARQVSETLDGNDALMTALATDTPPEGPADKPTRDRLSALLTKMGWTKRHMPDILRMFSHYCGREIGSVMSVRAGEVINLTAALVQLQKDTPEDGWTVALADKSAEWAEKWAETDPAGYHAYVGDE